MTRKGKIARLPVETRNLLNRRLQDGEPGARLVEWLNGLPVVQQVLTAEFNGRPVTEQNLSEWKGGGYEDWLQHQETREWVRGLAEKSAELNADAGNGSLADLLSGPLAMAFGRILQQVSAGAPNDPASQKTLFALAREVFLVRRGDHAEKRARLADERWKTEQAVAAEEKRKKDEDGARWAARVENGFADLHEKARIMMEGPIPPELRALSFAVAKMPWAQGPSPTTTQTASPAKSK